MSKPQGSLDRNGDDVSYRVKLVDDDALPDGHLWAMVRPEGEDCVLFVKHKHFTQRDIDEAIEAFQRLDCSESVSA